MTLGRDRYYILTTTNNHLFDSFIIDHTGDTAVISVFQITISPRYGESHKGYTFIRKTMAHVHDLLRKKGCLRPGSQ